MRKVLLFLFLFGSLSNLFGQKSPYFIRNYRTNEYGGFNQTWQITQDELGMMYIASTSAIYQFDGLQWQEIPVKRGAANRQVFYDSASAVIYVGSVSEFGYLEKDANGKFKYVSFVPQLNEAQKKFLDVWKVHKKGNRFYFQSTERIFVVENKKLVGTIEASEGKGFALMFNCGGKLFVRQRTVGIMEVDGLQLKLVPNSEAYGSIRILGMLAANDTLAYVLTGDQGVHRFTGWKKGETHFNPQVTAYDSLLYTSGVLGIEWISPEKIAVYSRIGLMIFDTSWQLENFFTQNSGLNDESISELYMDREKNIWLASNNGFSRISYNSPALFYSDETGFTGTLEALRFIDSTIYLATSEGFYKSEGETNFGSHLSFKRAIDLRTEVWDIYPQDKVMFLCTSEGLVEYNFKTARNITNYYSNQCLRATGERPLVFVTERGGFSILAQNAQGSWSHAYEFELPGMELMRMGEPQQESGSVYSFWSTTRLKTLAHITVNLADSSFTLREYKNENGVPELDFYPVIAGDSLRFVTYTEAIRFVPSKDKDEKSLCFEKDPVFFARLFNSEVKNIRAPFNFRLFIEQKNSPNTVFFGKDAAGFYEAPVQLGNIFDGISIQYGYIQNRQTLWLLNQQELAQYNLEESIDKTQKYYALISQVEFKGDSTGLFYPVKSSEELEIAYAKNAVTFRFSAPYFMYDLKSQFSYQLIGYDTGWSKFSRASEKEYTNLPEGKYTFRVRAKNSFGVISEEGSFTFTILPPWYRSGWAYVFYGLVILLLFWLTIRLSARRLRKQKERLEKLVTTRTTEVVKQKQQIEIQKLELESAYTDIKDSIQYALRIQEAMLPLETEINNLFRDSFIYFRPRDIVSGDFYWFLSAGGKSFIACVDCTGHGVPGALMSMIGNTILNQLVIEKKIESPDIILNELHTGVRHALKQDTGGETRDGMDIALCIIDHEQNRLSYAGANRPYWMIRKDALTEIKADKFPIAGDQVEEVRRFTAHSVSLEEGDCIYLSSDGYADQFGGPKGKKFMIKKFQQLLLSICKLPMQEQKNILQANFIEWKSNLEQVDDVLVIGFRYQIKS